MRRAAIVVLLAAGAVFSVSAQQITRFAVVDLVKVYSAFFNESRAVREFNERSVRVQNEINRLNQELQETKANLVNAQARGDREQALRLESEVNKKTRFIQEYYQTNMADLEAQKARLAQSDAFLNQINNEVRLLAETEGYSMVLNKQEGSGILWYSPAVDITNRLIEQLRSKAGR
ncbi:MAG: OmpH family outer membrane protein [Treponema sp.]|jgi:outer membrane protein|nr:OmpH family outer membrane protein [Treponema sp.]